MELVILNDGDSVVSAAGTETKTAKGESYRALAVVNGDPWLLVASFTRQTPADQAARAQAKAKRLLAKV